MSSATSAVAPNDSAGRFRWAAWAGGALVVVVTVAAFLPALQDDFVNWDDVANFVMNPYYRGLGWANLRWMFTSTHVGHYTPLTWLTLGLDYLLWGMNPRGYHLSNLLLHAANVGLLYVAAHRLYVAAFAGGVTAPPAPGRGEQAAALWIGAAFAALVFGVHPLRVESVAWVTERRDVLCGLFYLLAVLAYLRGVEQGGGGMIQRRWWALSLGAFLLALLSKAAAMPLPAALLVLDIYPLGRVAAVRWRRLLIEKVPYLVLGGGAALVALVAQSQAHAVSGYQQYGIGSRLAMMAYSVMFYPWKFLWWANLSPVYELPARVDPLAPRFLLPMIGLMLVTTVLAAVRRRWPAALAAWVYSALLVLPVSGAIVHAGVQLAADRYSYLSGLGFALLAGSALVGVLQARRRLKPSVVGACVLVAVLVPIGLAAGTWRQSKIWRDTETLWRHALYVNPRSPHAHYDLGNWLRAVGRPQEAQTEYERAVALADRADLKAAALDGLAALLNTQGVAQAQRGELQSALGSFLQALSAVPGYPDACRNLRTLAGMIRVDPQELRRCPEAPMHVGRAPRPLEPAP